MKMKHLFLAATLLLVAFQCKDEKENVAPEFITPPSCVDQFEAPVATTIIGVPGTIGPIPFSSRKGILVDSIQVYTSNPNVSFALHPCNLDLSQIEDGTKIFFDAQIMSTTGDIVFSPVSIIKYKIIK